MPNVRIRYSLLTLLILTALVAGGVKLWYGPHHVVERPKPHREEEYTYTRDWRGAKVIHGPWATRFYRPDGSLASVLLQYYRRGEKTLNFVQFQVVTPGTQVLPIPPCGMPPHQLTPGEQLEFKAALDDERQHIRELGLIPIEF